MKKISTKDLVSTYYGRSSCEISHYGDGIWYINRVFVQESERNMGLGSILLECSINDIIEKYKPEAILVTPGGYNADEAKQFNFYFKNGFKESSNSRHVLFCDKLKDLELK
jgi:GNAT superfamily N-acetyltransferase